MTFIANQPDQEQDEIITSDFWPDVSISEFKDLMRVGGTAVTIPRIKQAVINAIMTLNSELSEKLAIWQAEGFTSLDAVPSPSINGESQKLATFRTAIFSLANAELIETHPDLSSTREGFDAMSEFDKSKRALRRIAIKSIRSLGDKPSTFISVC